MGYEGEAPTGMNVRYADSTFGTAAAFSALVALLHRRRTGEGQCIDVSAVETMTSMIGDAVMDYSVNGVIRQCDGNRHRDMAPHGVYPCRDHEWLCLAVASNSEWQTLAQAMGRPQLAEDSRFSELAARQLNAAELDRLLAAWTTEQAADSLAATLQSLGLAASKSLNSLELVADANLWQRGFYQEVSDHFGVSRSILGPSWRMTRMAEIRDDAPALGQHNAYVFGQLLGLSEQEQQALTAAGITR